VKGGWGWRSRQRLSLTPPPSILVRFPISAPRTLGEAARFTRRLLAILLAAPIGVGRLVSCKNAAVILRTRSRTKPRRFVWQVSAILRTAPPAASPARLDHRSDACSDRGRQARPCLDHHCEVAVGRVEHGHFHGHFPRICVFLGVFGPRRRIANPPSSVRLRPEPLRFRPLRSSGIAGFRGGFCVSGALALGPNHRPQSCPRVPLRAPSGRGSISPTPSTAPATSSRLAREVWQLPGKTRPRHSGLGPV